MNQNTITVQLTVNDDGSVVMKQFGKNSEDALNKTTAAAPKATSALDSLKSSYIDCAAKAATAYMAISKAMEYMDLGAQSIQIASSFKIMSESAGANTEQMLSYMEKATQGTIADCDLMQKSVKMMTLGFDPAQIERFSKVVITASQIAGTSATEAYDRLADAISTRMPRALISMGAVTKDQMKVVNEAIAAGADSTELFELAMANLELKEKMLQGTQDEATLAMQRFQAQAKQTKDDIGVGLLVAAQKLYAAFQDIAGVSLLAAAGIFEVLRGQAILNAQGSDGKLSAYFSNLAAGYKEDAETAMDAALDLFDKASKNLAGAVDIEKKATQQEIADSQLKVDAKMKEMKAFADANEKEKNDIQLLTEIMKIAGASESEQLKANIAFREAANQKYYDDIKQKIIQNAAIETAAGMNQSVIDKNVADRIKELDDEILKKHTSIEQQKILLSMKTAQDDIKNLTSQLADYQKYYDSLKAMMDKNLADEKKHEADLKAIQQQRVDNQKLAAGLIAQMNGTAGNMTAQQTYESGRSSLNQQFMNITNTMTGQDQVKALEDYMKAVTALQQQFEKGVQGAKDIFGKPQDIISAAKVLEDATSDVNTAERTRESTLVSLAAAQQQQIDTDQLWGQMLQTSLTEAQTQMDKLKQTISDLSDQIKNMQKTVELTGIDKVSSVVTSIMDRIQQLHALAAQPITLNAVLGGSGGASFIPGLPTNPFSSAGNGNSYNTGSGDYADISEAEIASYAVGTNYVPRTGLYQLHQGEAVVSAAKNSKVGGIVINGGINLQIPVGSAPQRPEDWRSITRNYIVPELRKLSN